MLDACKTLNTRLAPVKAKMKPPVAWADLIAQCYAEGMCLTATGWTNTPPTTDPFNYMRFFFRRRC